MKRAVLLMFMLAMLSVISVGIENPIEKEKVSVAYDQQVNSDVDFVAITNLAVAIYVDVAETGESIADYAPVAIWTDIVSPVDVKPPIATDAKVFNLPEGSATRYSWT